MIKKKSDFLANKDNWQYINWKSVSLLKKYITRFDNLKPRSYSKHSVTAQKKLKSAVTRAKELGLLPYVK